MDCQKLVDNYIEWLRSKIKTTDINGACEITTPFLDRHNDHIQVFIIPTSDGMRITDDGYIISDLKMSGCQLNKPNRKKTFETILNGFGVHVNKDDELYVEASPENFPQKKHSLIQAMLAVNDMFMTAKGRVASYFLEDVSHFLDDNNIRYTPDIGVIGKAGFTHKFDFVIPKSNKSPERLLRAINNPTKDSVTSLLFAWEDTKENRSKESQFYVMLNDKEKSINSDLLSALHQYKVKTLPWSQRDQYVIELAA